MSDGAHTERGVAEPGRRRGTNLPAMADFNQLVILDAVRRSPAGLSRVELAVLTGLSAQTVTNITRRLLDAALIVEAGKESIGPGKPRTILRLNPPALYAVGVHLDPTVTTAVLLDLAGDVVLERRILTPLGQHPETAIDALVEMVEGVLTDSAVDRARVAGMGIAAPGPIDPIAGALVEPPHLPGWHSVPLRDELSRRLGLVTVLEKDVAAATIAELWAGTPAASTGSFVFLYLGTGLGAGLAINHEVVRGSLANAGEIGHIVVVEDGPPCWCGLRGCVAVTCTPEAIVRDAIAEGLLDSLDSGDDTTAVDAALTMLAARAEAGEAGAVAVLDRAAARIARALAVIANLLDLDRIVLGGPIWNRVADRFVTIIPAELDRMRAARSIHPVAIGGTTLGDAVAAMGAASLVLDRWFSPRTESLLLPSSSA
ncbi:putative NBD/HSP70 family sugar kinase [Microcella putealis]|uniref:Putative NBD/HSP70 family sugar kinase n=2 Tax=Microcella putealis TaxID=337005 RepID=A0A4Q7M071_9MICO|nr:putative NBD/HSP70 family sugar kinase [Microcella putealis]TQM26841.1 putative NBD/HSP70 family sugar kinase [Microcella putealis]